MSELITFCYGPSITRDLTVEERLEVARKLEAELAALNYQPVEKRRVLVAEIDPDHILPVGSSPEEAKEYHLRMLGVHERAYLECATADEREQFYERQAVRCEAEWLAIARPVIDKTDRGYHERGRRHVEVLRRAEVEVRRLLLALAPPDFEVLTQRNVPTPYSVEDLDESLHPWVKSWNEAVAMERSPDSWIASLTGPSTSTFARGWTEGDALARLLAIYLGGRAEFPMT